MTASAATATEAIVDAGFPNLMSVSLCRRRIRRRDWKLFFPRAGHSFNQIENCRNKEDANGTGRQHAPDDRSAHDLPRHRTGAGSDPQRNASEYECERRHEDRPKAKSCAFERRFG